MKNLTLKNIAEVCRGVYCGAADALHKEVTSITTDSRTVEEGGLFVAIVGERVDAHRFIPDVMQKGALAALCEKAPENAEYPYIQVESTLQAVKDIAEFYLEQLQIPVVGITGSVGKTSTKEVIASVLEQKYKTLKTQGNFNNELGLPLTVFRLREEHEMAVLEMGISEFGEMSRLAKIAKPNTSVITNIGTCHLETLGDKDGVLKAKTEVFAYLKENGNIVLNGDDEKLASVQEYQGIQPVFFGIHSGRSVYADEITPHGLKGISCKIHLQEDVFEVNIPVPGIHTVYNALAASVVGKIYGLSCEQIKKGIESLQTISGRFKILETEKFLIVDDCYNANPMSVKASLDVLKDAAGSRRVAILGDMAELGDDEIALHESVGEHAANCDLELCVCVGTLSRHLAEKITEVNPKMQVIYIETQEKLLENLSSFVKDGDTILVKASHCMAFEEVVKALQEM